MTLYSKTPRDPAENPDNLTDTPYKNIIAGFVAQAICLVGIGCAWLLVGFIVWPLANIIGSDSLLLVWRGFACILTVTIALAFCLLSVETSIRLTRVWRQRRQAHGA